MNNLWKYGNTSDAAVPICLHVAALKGGQKGDLIMLVAFGTGFSWVPSLLRWAVRSLTSRSSLVKFADEICRLDGKSGKL